MTTDTTFDVKKHKNNDNLANRIVSSKYTLINFIPKNIFMQLSKTSTLFFFLTLILLCIPAVSPFEPYTYAFAFSIVVGTSMIKDGIEDYRRHREDNEANSKKIQRVVSKDGRLSNYSTTVENVNNGDILIIEENEMLPADCLILKAFDEVNGEIKDIEECYVETSNLDGETNLKKKYVLYGDEVEKEQWSDITQCILSTECIKDMYETITEYTIKDTGETFAEYHAKVKRTVKRETNNTNNSNSTNHDIANVKNVLLRGSILKNTSAVVVLVLAVGKNTKMSMSTKNNFVRRSSFETLTNNIIYFILVIYVLIFITTTLYAMFNNTVSAPLSKLDIFKTFFTNYILYTYLIPLSLFVTLEIARIFHVLFIAYDKEMTYKKETTERVTSESTEIEEESINARCRNSNVIEDLGLIDYVLTDKTGTLTNNTMELKKYVAYNKENILGTLDKNEYLKRNNTNEQYVMFILGLLICTEVDILIDDTKEDYYDQITYEGVSQEEISILNTMKEHKMIIKEKTQKKIVLKIDQKEITVKIVDVLKFTSVRQRQSVIVEIKTKDIAELINNQKITNESLEESKTFLFTKGSDSKVLRNFMNVFEAYDNNEQLLKYIKENHGDLNVKYKEGVLKSLQTKEDTKYENIMKIINSSTEYRALVYGYKQIHNYNQLIPNIIQTNNIPTKDSDKTYERIFSIMEFNVDFIGCTLIEDSLQEDMYETITAIRENGIKIWMITGDKKETAVACGKNSGLIKNQSNAHNNYNYLAIIGRDAVNILKEEVRLREQQGNIFVDPGLTLNSVNQPESYDILSFETIVVYRATPSQKSEICKCLNKLGYNTMAVGDGNNDVGMLKEANVGVGIQGKEGNQAALNSDFSIIRFRNIHKLLLCYGHNTLVRFSKLTLNAFYKNLYFILIQYFYNYYNMGTGFPVYNNIFLNYFNTFYTALIPISIVLFDKEFRYEKIQKERSHNINSRNNNNARNNSYLKSRCHFAPNVILLNLMLAIAQAMVSFALFRIFLSKGLSNSTGLQAGYGAESQLISMCVFFTVILRQVRMVSFYNIFTYLSIIISVIFAFVVQLIFQSMPIVTETVFGSHTFLKLLSMPIAYFIITVVMSTMYVMEVVFEFIEHSMIQREYVKIKMKKNIIKNEKNTN